MPSPSSDDAMPRKSCVAKLRTVIRCRSEAEGDLDRDECAPRREELTDVEEEDTFLPLLASRRMVIFEPWTFSTTTPVPILVIPSLPSALAVVGTSPARPVSFHSLSSSARSASVSFSLFSPALWLYRLHTSMYTTKAMRTVSITTWTGSSRISATHHEPYCWGRAKSRWGRAPSSPLSPRSAIDDEEAPPDAALPIERNRSGDDATVSTRDWYASWQCRPAR
mmetsp:Transcript_23476/g.67654  ORF Transcript_23476/g.67654 Transcript_23476/m.67654 type:complete len:223 (+) Transcript_23476:2194-2862(+)